MALSAALALWGLTPGTAAEETSADTIQALEAQFGGPSANGFGSAVFVAPLPQVSGLEQEAQRVYRSFTGELWERWGEAAWMTSWKRVHVRSGPGDIVSELKTLPDADASRSASVMLEGVEDPQAAALALAAVFDAPDVLEVHVYRIGDGAEMSGLIIAARRAGEDAVFVVFLLD